MIPLDMLEGGPEDDSDDGYDENPVHDARPINNVVGLGEQLCPT